MACTLPRALQLEPCAAGRLPAVLPLPTRVLVECTAGRVLLACGDCVRVGAGCERGVRCALGRVTLTDVMLPCGLLFYRRGGGAMGGGGAHIMEAPEAERLVEGLKLHSVKEVGSTR